MRILRVLVPGTFVVTVAVLPVSSLLMHAYRISYVQLIIGVLYRLINNKNDNNNNYYYPYHYCTSETMIKKNSDLNLFASIRGHVASILLSYRYLLQIKARLNGEYSRSDYSCAYREIGSLTNERNLSLAPIYLLDNTNICFVIMYLVY